MNLYGTRSLVSFEKANRASRSFSSGRNTSVSKSRSRRNRRENGKWRLLRLAYASPQRGCRRSARIRSIWRRPTRAWTRESPRSSFRSRWIRIESRRLPVITAARSGLRKLFDQSRPIKLYRNFVLQE